MSSEILLSEAILSLVNTLNTRLSLVNTLNTRLSLVNTLNTRLSLVNIPNTHLSLVNREAAMSAVNRVFGDLVPGGEADMASLMSCLKETRSIEDR